jgi:hypothetical protein
MVSESTKSAIRNQFNVKHVRKQGARFHVHSYGLYESYHKRRAITWCSEAFCTDNRVGVFTCIEMGLDPARMIPSVAAKEWLSSRAGRAALATEQPNE